MVDIFIDCITTLEFIIYTAIVEYHVTGINVGIINNVTVGVTSYRTGIIITVCLSCCCGISIICVLTISAVIVVETINALVTESINTTQSITNLNTTQIVLIGIVEFCIHTCQHGGIHLINTVDILCDVSTNNH